MNSASRRLRGSRGQVMIEFAFTLLLSVPLILGILAIGIRYVRELKITQISRDLANMYARGVDFNASGAANIVQRLGPGFDFSSSGNGVAILSKVRKVTSAECTANGVALGGCNANQAVFEQQIVFGNSAVRPSNFGTPTGLASDKTTTEPHQRTVAANVARGFLIYLDLHGDPLTREHAYMVEVIVNTGDLDIPGFMTQTQAYSRNIF
jgi:hypothetical protein